MVTSKQAQQDNREAVALLTQIYQQAYAVWQAGDGLAAAAILEDFWQRTGLCGLRDMLLRAYCLRDAKKYLSEIAQLEKLLQLFATSPERTLVADAWSLLGSALRQLGESQLAVEAFRKAAEVEPRTEQKLVELSNALFTADAITDFTPASFRQLYASYQKQLQALQLPVYPKPDWRHERLRIGYLSADFGSHPVGQFIAPLFSRYDRKRFVVYAYDRHPHQDRVAAALRAGGAIWREVQELSLPELAARIRADEIDILVDFSGHTKNNALPVLASRVAPVQISGIGYFNSTGLKETTGFLSDVYCAPQACSPYFIEPLLRLPHSHFCYAPFTVFPPVGDLPCRQRGHVTFGCFNNFAKVTDAMLACWRDILLALPTAHLVLKHLIFDSDEGRAYEYQRMERIGLPLARVELHGFSRDYLTQYHDIDIALDTSPYAGGLTTCEALYMGVPVVTLVGDHHGARFGYSFLSNIGLPELAAATPQQYVELAVQLAGDPELLAVLRQTLRTRMQKSPLMDQQGYMRELEALYIQLYDMQRRNLS